MFRVHSLYKLRPCILTSKSFLLPCNRVRYNCFSTRPMAFQAPLDRAAGPLVWIDCEMTGLDHKKDKIIEIAVLITDGNLQIVDEGIDYVVRTEKSLLDGMDGMSGLTQACLTSQWTHDLVRQKVLSYIQKWVPHNTGVLAGSSVHVDRLFLLEQMPEVINWLRYRWYPSLRDRQHETSHR
ncbi:ribonuclease H-like domain-containing protein [Desarmillaria tabescens]|uniref:Ribonuclease H-like domain-containing protein n=1 Tax=Armillaria tabescens TaxID=1929756 RepID=A0AA39T321_ARMTA|nr:ribonuclease H-like domain-containing protein [Desarmillaria tabescens]KAK0460931.1 ribonuclease H-like domain-containing protein [Desarmillaria tabescens]